MTNTYVYHSGILNMKWHRRKYQNPDGTWTEEGKARRRAAYAAQHPERFQTTQQQPKTAAQYNKEIKNVERERELQNARNAKILDQLNFEAQCADQIRRAREAKLNYQMKVAEIERMRTETAIGVYKAKHPGGQQSQNQVAKGESYATRVLKESLGKLVLGAAATAAPILAKNALKKRGFDLFDKKNDDKKDNKKDE